MRAARKFKLRRFITHARGTCFARASFLKSVILSLLSHFFRIILRNGGGYIIAEGSVSAMSVIKHTVADLC